MSDNLDLQKEEFIQNYQQYRWLDETRSKLVDRFFIVLVAILVSRFQFTNFFDTHLVWELVLYTIFVFVSPFMAKSIVWFRRQQRGQVLYIKAIREKILDEAGELMENLAQYKRYITGKSVYLTKWIEFSVAIIATGSPFLYSIVLSAHSEKLCLGLRIIAWIAIISTALCIMRFLFWPWYKYNYKRTLDWDKD